MTHFTTNNTEGFTNEELNEMNAAFDAIFAEFNDFPEHDTVGTTDFKSHVSDFINNYYPATKDEYVAAYKARRGA